MFLENIVNEVHSNAEVKIEQVGFEVDNDDSYILVTLPESEDNLENTTKFLNFRMVGVME